MHVSCQYTWATIFQHYLLPFNIHNNITQYWYIAQKYITALVKMAVKVIVVKATDY